MNKEQTNDINGDHYPDAPKNEFSEELLKGFETALQTLENLIAEPKNEEATNEEE